MDSKDQHDNKASRRQLTTTRDQREDGSHSAGYTTSQHVCQSASQHGHNTNRKRKLDVRTQHSDTSSQHNHDAQLRDAVSDGRWWDVPNLISSDVSDTCRAWAVEEACKHADDTLIGVSILPGCTHVLLSSVVPVLVRRGLWPAVCQSLDLGVSDEHGRFAVETASEEADEDFVLLLLPYCPDDLLNTVLGQVTRRGLWRAVIAVLQRGVSDTERKLAVQAACDRADEHHLTHGILGHCHDDQMDSVLTRLVERSLWGAARWLLVQSRDDESVHGVSTETLTELIQATDDRVPPGIGTGTDTPCTQTSNTKLCHDGSIGIYNWNTQAVDDISSPDAFTATHTHCTAPAKDTDCNGEMNDACAVLTQAVKRRLWCIVSAVLHYISNNGDSRYRDIQRWAVEEACKHAADRQLSEVATTCGEDELDVVLKETTTRGLWKTVCTVLERASHRAQTDTGVTQRRGVVRYKCTNRGGVKRNTEKFVIQLDGIRNINVADAFSVFITQAISGGMMEGCCVNVIGFSKVAKYAAVLQEAMRRGLYERPDVDTDDGGNRCDRENLWYRGFYTVIKGKHADLGRNGPVHTCERTCCARRQDLLIINKSVTVRPGMQEPFYKLLTITDYISSSDTERRAVEEACKRADDEEFVAIVDVCAVDQLNTMLTEAVRRGLWKTVNWLLARIRITDTRDTHRVTVEEECTRTEDGGCVAIIRFSTQARREYAMTAAVIACLGERTNNDSEACKRTDDGGCVAVCFSTQAQRDAVMTEAVRRGLFERINHDSGASYTERLTVRTDVWTTFCRLLQTVNAHICNTSDTERWAVKEACKRADDGEFIYIVNFRDENQLDTVLTEAVRRGLWKTVVRLLFELRVTQLMLHPVICNSLRWAVEEVCKCSSDADCKCIAHFCDEHQLDDVLTEAVRRGLWQTVTVLLHRIRRKRDSNANYARRRAVEEACERADDDDWKKIVVFYDEDQYENDLRQAVTRGLWKTVTRLLYQIRKERVSNANYARRRAVEEACKRADDDDLENIVVFCDEDQCENVLRQAVTRRLRKTLTNLLSCEYTNSGTLTWFGDETYEGHTDEDSLLSVVNYVGWRHARSVVRLLLRKGMFDWASDIFRQFVGKKYAPIAGALAHWAGLFVDSLSVQFDEDLDAANAELELNNYLDSLTNVMDTSLKIVIYALQHQHEDAVSVTPESFVWWEIYSVLREESVQNTDVYPHFFKWCAQRRGGTTSLCQLSLPLIATQTANPALQSLARTSMWEETRRWYLQFLVEEKLWSVVKEVADHSVYDDQRAWALEQARHHKQWDVVVHLADHGLTDNHRWRVYRQVAKYADWDTVRLLFKQGVDMRRVCEELMAANPSRERPPDNEADIERRRNRGEDVSKLEAEYRERSERVARLALEHKQRCRELDILEKRQAGRRRDGKMSWYAVLSQLRQDVTEEGIEMTLLHAIQSEAWSVVMQLVRLGMDAAQRDQLLPETIRRRQWGVARALLEHGVSVELCRAALPELMDTDQWILVARVMEQSLDDTDRRRVMQAALDKKEGSVVAHGISVMEGRLSVEERQAMYDQALSQGVWQAVRRLMEEKDNTGIAQRDESLVAAVDNHRWDIVEHCVLQGADINKRNDDGDTILHEKAKRGAWDSVGGLVHCGADPNTTDKGGYSAFHTAVHGIQVLFRSHYKGDILDEIKTLVKFHGNLNRPDPEGRSPLHQLINCHHTSKAAEILDEALWWGSDVAQGQRVESGGRTVLHVMCQAGRWKSLQYFLARGVHPLITEDGDTALVVAVTYEKDRHQYQKRSKWDADSRECRQKLVAECIKLGICTHQPPITHSTDIWHYPVYISIKRKDLVVLHMLYESGASSHRELLKVLDHPPKPPDPDARTYRNKKDLYEKVKSHYKQCRSYLKKVASTPRSLQSSCRLVISHHLGICKTRTRQKRVKQLRLPDRMEDYVLFSDLVDSDKVKDTVTQLITKDDTESDISDDGTESYISDVSTESDISDVSTESDISDVSTESDISDVSTESDISDVSTESDISDDGSKWTESESD